MGTIIYLTMPQSRWHAGCDGGFYGKAALDQEGFLHCSDEKTLEQVVRRKFQQEDDLLLVTVDAGQVTAPVRWEDLKSKGIAYPHIYGLLNLDAVLRTQLLARDGDGNHILPGGEGT